MRITNEAEYEAALDTCETLINTCNYYNERLETVSRAIEEYEDIHYPMDKPSLWARIKFRLGQRFGWLGW